MRDPMGPGPLCKEMEAGPLWSQVDWVLWGAELQCGPRDWFAKPGN